tara:strand:+ start:75 stop:371 length:297 start_codon:yes stop_codon:yes gene_type:complete
MVVVLVLTLLLEVLQEEMVVLHHLDQHFLLLVVVGEVLDLVVVIVEDLGEDLTVIGPELLVKERVDRVMMVLMEQVVLLNHLVGEVVKVPLVALDLLM